MRARKGKVARPPTPEDEPLVLLFLQLAFHQRMVFLHEARGSFRMVAKEAVPLLRWSVELEDIEETSSPQLVHQVVLVFCGRKGRHHEIQKRLVVALQDVPAILQAADGRITCAQCRRGT